MSKKCESADDISALHEELKNAIDADKLYWIRNEAKLRAVQTSKSYEEFRNIVDAAHLQPVKKEDKSKKDGGNSSWNRALNN